VPFAFVVSAPEVKGQLDQVREDFFVGRGVKVRAVAPEPVVEDPACEVLDVLDVSECEGRPV
jgi:hypothetical protein